jgi:hypothetical protein
MKKITFFYFFIASVCISCELTNEPTNATPSSSNADLKSVEITGGVLTPVFSPSTTNYTIRINFSASSSLTINATASDQKAVISDYQKTVDLTQSVPNRITITVTAEDGSIKSYSFQLVDITPHHIYYNGNDSTAGTVPSDITEYIAGEQITIMGKGDLEKTGFSFCGWSTQPDGTGTVYQDGNTIVCGDVDITLYAVWKTFTLIYDGNGNSAGNPPSDTHQYNTGEAATILEEGNLENYGFIFDGWNTQADGNGTTYHIGDTLTFGSSDITLYAKWKTFLTYRYGYASPSDIYITGYAGTDLNVIIPPYIEGKPVTEIGSYALANKMLTSVSLPNTLVSIGGYAFEDNELVSVVIPDSVTSISARAFYNNHLTSLILGSGLTSVGSESYYGTSIFAGNELTSIVIPNGISYICSGAFSGNSLTSITIGSNVTIDSGSSMGRYGEQFRTYYANNGRKAGVYTYSGGYNGEWSWNQAE